MRAYWRSFLIGLALVAAPAGARERGQWVEAWQSSPAANLLADPETISMLAKMVGIPPEAAAKLQPKAMTGTLCYRLRLYASGSEVRIRLSNEEGKTPLRIAAASIGLAGDGFNAATGSIRTVTFGGKSGITLPAGAPALSDPIQLSVKRGAEIIVSLHPQDPFLPEIGGAGVAVSPGDQTAAESLGELKRIQQRPIVTGISVLSPARTNVIVAFGDSITDGNRPTTSELQSWPERLSQRLAEKSGDRWSVVNAGISGNCLLDTFMGDAALSRLDRDVLRVEGVTHIVLLEGINDIRKVGSETPVTSEDLIGAYRQIIARAHGKGIKVFIGTLLPASGSPSHGTPEKDAVRRAVNDWIRSSSGADAVIDFDKAIRDPADPSKMSKQFDSGDHLHPNPEGSKAMADAIDLRLFK